MKPRLKPSNFSVPAHRSLQICRGREPKLLRWWSESRLRETGCVPFQMLFFVRLDDDLVFDIHRLQVLHGEFRRYCACAAEPANLAHSFVEQQSDDSAVCHSSGTRVTFSQNEAAGNLARRSVLFERELHSGFIGAAASETGISRIWLQPNDFAGIAHFPPCFKPARLANVRPFEHRADACAFRP
jgi:hypothetical protein